MKRARSDFFVRFEALVQQKSLREVLSRLDGGVRKKVRNQGRVIAEQVRERNTTCLHLQCLVIDRVEHRNKKARSNERLDDARIFVEARFLTTQRSNGPLIVCSFTSDPSSS